MQSKVDPNGLVSGANKHGAQFTGVRDSRNRRVAGIYVRNGRYYAQLWVDRDDGQKIARKFPLLTADGDPVTNLVQAKEAADVPRNDRREKNLPTSGHKPKFADYVETYFLPAAVTCALADENFAFRADFTAAFEEAQRLRMRHLRVGVSVDDVNGWLFLMHPVDRREFTAQRFASFGRGGLGAECTCVGGEFADAHGGPKPVLLDGVNLNMTDWTKAVLPPVQYPCAGKNREPYPRTWRF